MIPKTHLLTLTARLFGIEQGSQTQSESESETQWQLVDSNLKLSRTQVHFFNHRATTAPNDLEELLAPSLHHIRVQQNKTTKKTKQKL